MGREIYNVARSDGEISELHNEGPPPVDINALVLGLFKYFELQREKKLSQQFGRDYQKTMSHFEYKTPSSKQITLMGALRENFRQTADAIMNFCPESPERTIALRTLHDANMQANVAIMFNVGE